MINSCSLRGDGTQKGGHCRIHMGIWYFIKDGQSDFQQLSISFQFSTKSMLPYGDELWMDGDEYPSLDLFV